MADGFAMHRPHFIDQAVFDIGFDEETAVENKRVQVERFLHNELIQLVDEIFDEAARKDRVYRVDLLEIDLGEIPYNDYPYLMRKRLRRLLTSKLADMSQPSQGQPRQQQGFIDKETADQQTLFDYLQQGFLPWYARAEAIDAMDDMLQQMLRETPQKLIDFINNSAERKVVLERINRQFSAQSMAQLEVLLSSSSIKKASELDDLHERMSVALRAVDVKTILGFWPELYSLDSVGLEKMLREFGQSASLRKRIARDFPQPIREQLVILLEPGEQGFILRLMAQPELLQPRQSQQLKPRQQTEALWEFTLSYLLVERGSHFNKKSYLASLTRQMAAAGNLSQAELVASLLENLRQLPADNRVGREMYQILSELSEEKSSSGEAVQTAELYAQYDRLRNGIFVKLPTSAREEIELREAIQMLLRFAPWLIMRLYREWQSDANARTVTTGLSSDLLSELVLAVLTVSTHSQPGMPSDLTQAVKQHAPKARDQKSYYLYLLNCLLSGESIDFEAIPLANEFTKPGPETTDNSDLTSLPSEQQQVERILKQGSIDLGPLLRIAEMLNTACHQALVGINSTWLNAFKWRFIREYLSNTGFLFNESRFIRDYVKGLIAKAGQNSEHQVRSLLVEYLQKNAVPSSGALTKRMVELLRAQKQVNRQEAAETFDDEIDEADISQDIYIANAGLVLLAPYLPRLFEQFGLTQKSAFKNREAAERAAHLAQFLVNEQTVSPEYQLVLNKLLCGIKPGQPIRRSIDLSDDEKQQLEALLQAVTQHWKALANTSIDGLRESFLQRGGRLQLKQDAWHLVVEEKPFDMLLDQIPWSFSMIKFAWMDRVIYVEWRT